MMVCCEALERAAWCRQRPSRQWEPRDEAQRLGFTCLEHRFGGEGGQVVHILHRHDGRDLLRGFQLLDADPREPDMAYLALLLQRGELAHLILQGEVVVDS